MTIARSALFALALALVTPPYAILALASFPLPRMARYRLISAWSRLVIWLAWVICGIRWKIEGRRHLPDEPAVILSQHQSAWETVAFQEIFPPQVLVLKRELLWIPFFGWGLALMSPIAIDRARGVAAMREMARRGRERLAQGFWVVVFPEGTRVRPGEKRAYQQGGAWLAVNCGEPMPTSKAVRPASTAWAKATAMRFGSGATAMAVFTRTASAPNSMASAAWLGTPRPASTTTGTVA